MASNVFGMVVDDEVVRAEDEYYMKKGAITREDRAHVAFKKKNDGNKAVEARAYADRLNSDWGWGTSTRCLLYNATGDSLTFVLNYDWHGEIGASPYPLVIENGQWGAFLHERKGTFGGTSAAVVYRGKDADNSDCDWMLAWHNPFEGQNCAYTEIRRAYHYQYTNHWEYINGLLRRHNYTDNGFGKTMSTVIIGQDTHAIFEAQMTLI